MKIILEVDEIQAKLLLDLLQNKRLTSAEKRELIPVELDVEHQISMLTRSE